MVGNREREEGEGREGCERVGRDARVGRKQKGETG